MADVNALARLLEVEIVDRPGKMSWSFQFALDRCLVNHAFRSDIGELTSLPRFHLLAHGIEVPLHPARRQLKCNR